MRRGAAGLAALALVAGCGGSEDGTRLASSLPVDGRSPRAGAGADIRVMVELQRPSLGERLEHERLSPGEQRAYFRSLEHEVQATRSALEARGVRLHRIVTFGRLWNGFAATVSSEHLPEVATLGLRAEPVRRFFPAAALTGELPPSPSPGATRKPVMALLDSPASPLEGLLRAELPEGAGLLDVRVTEEERDPERGTLQAVATTDRLVAGLERSVDPDGDGDVEDALAVAVVGVNSPYAGFSDSPEARAAAAALAAGTLVVAPAGNEPPARGAPFGTVGSPAAASSVIAVGATEAGGAPAPPEVELGIATGDGRARLRGRVLSGTALPGSRRLAVLNGPSQADPGATGRSSGERLLDYYTVDARPRARDRAVVVPLGRANLAATAAAAGQAGVTVLVVAAPEGGLAPLPEGVSAPAVYGLSGEAATRALELTRESGGILFASRAKPARDERKPASSPASARGLTYGRLHKPDTVAHGTARVAGAFVSGTGVAAARVGARGAEIAMRRPGLAPEQIADQLVGARPWPAPVLRLDLPAPRLGAVTLVREGGEVTGVRFSAGAVRRDGRALAVEPVGRLVLELDPERGGGGRELTPPGGARDLLPGEYAYTLTGSILDELPAGRYRFTIRARGPAGGRQVLRRSDSFQVR